MPLLTNKNNILEALREHPRSSRKLWIEAGHERSFNEVITAAREAGVSFRVLAREEFLKRFKDTKSHLCLERDEVGYADQDVFIGEVSSCREVFVCAFDAIYDPQNLGNIIRSAACLGVSALIIPKDRSCGITEAVLTVSRGAIEHVKIIRVTNLARYLDELKELGVFCFGFDERGSTPVWSADLRGRICLVFGSEEGLRRLTKEKCDALLKIPTEEKFPSLNVATSFAVAAYEARRQRGGKPG